MIARFWFNTNASYVIAFLDKMLHNNYLCLVDSDKQQINKLSGLMGSQEGYGLSVGSMPKALSYHGDEDEVISPSEVKPRILLMGLRRSGKSSIQKVVFHKMSPNETLFLESTAKIFKDDVSNNSFINFQIWDIPGQAEFLDQNFDLEMIFGGTGALIFVIDAQDEYIDALTCLHETIAKAYQENPNIKFEVFIHKVDGLSDDHKIETQRDISQRANEELHEAGLVDLHLSFYLTSIYDHSIFEAFSKVVQKLIPQLSTLENLLSSFVQNSTVEKAFLFDVVSKIYIATDGSAVDMQSYELCCEMIDVMIDMTCIYGNEDSECACEHDSTCIIRLNNSSILYLREITRFLVLVCILRDEAFTKRDIIDFNILCLQQAIDRVFDLRGRISKQNGFVESMEGANALAYQGKSP